MNPSNTSQTHQTALPGWKRTTAQLSVGQVVAWGVLHYSFAVYLPQMRDDLGWSTAALTGGFALATIVAGVVAPIVGRFIDLRGSRLLMTTGTVAGIVGLTLWATANSIVVFYVAFIFIGLAMASTLYAPAFATVVQHYPTHSRQAIVTITLAGGLASTIFSPLAQVLSEQGSWRTGVVILTVGFALVTLPINMALPRGRSVTKSADDTEHDVAPLKDRPRTLWLLAAIFTLSAGVSAAFSIHIVAFLIDTGRTATAAASIAGAAGLGKVAGRALLAAGSRVSARWMLRACLLAQAAFLAMPLLWAHIASSIIMVVMFGATSGALTILRPLIVSDLVGSAQFASRNGEIQLATTLTKATTPVAVGLALGATSYEMTWLALASLAAGAAFIVGNLDSETD